MLFKNVLNRAFLAGIWLNINSLLHLLVLMYLALQNYEILCLNNKIRIVDLCPKCSFTLLKKRSKQ